MYGSFTSLLHYFVVYILAVDVGDMLYISCTVIIMIGTTARLVGTRSRVYICIYILMIVDTQTCSVVGGLVYLFG